MTAMVIGVILAGGIGSRFGQPTPKQFTALAGRPIMEYAVDAFVRHPDIERVVVTYPPDYYADVKKIIDKYRALKPFDLIEGGATRAASTLAALALVPEGIRCKMLFHDAVRPFVSADIISRTVGALDSNDAADVVINTADTVVELSTQMDTLRIIPDRSRMRRGQTPQGFWSDDLRTAYASMGPADLARFSDDCGVMLAWNPHMKIAAVEGSEINIKVTHPIDLFLAEQLLYQGAAYGLNVAPNPIKDPVAVIIGDTSGLGLAAKAYLVANGWRVYGASRSTGVDVRDIATIEARLAEVARETGKIDVVANFAGVLYTGALVDAPSDTIDDTISTNFLGSIHVARAAHSHLRVTKGQLVLCSSSSYFRGRKDTAAYSASKAAVVNLTQALAEEWAEEDIIVTCMVPRRADTPMRQKNWPDEDPSSRMSPEVVAVALQELLGRRQSGLIKHVY